SILKNIQASRQDTSCSVNIALGAGGGGGGGTTGGSSLQVYRVIISIAAGKILKAIFAISGFNSILIYSKSSVHLSQNYIHTSEDCNYIGNHVSPAKFIHNCKVNKGRWSYFYSERIGCTITYNIIA